MAESVKRSILPAAVTVLAGLIVYLVVISASAGALQSRVAELEKQQSSTAEKIDKLLVVQNDIRVSVARVEAKLEDKR